MKKRCFFLILLFIISAQCALGKPIENYNDVQFLEIAISISADIGVTSTSSNPKVEYIRSDLSFFPKDDERQIVEELNTFSSPDASVQQGEHEMTFLWTDFSGNKIEYGYEGKVKVNNIIPSVDKKLSFPLTKLDSTVLTYTQATEFIDINPKIEKKANEIIGAENDLYQVVYKLADWTHQNIIYNLSTLTAEAVQPSSWVLDNKKGVCDEMTNLFISFLRSVGIPARFVSGMVYTNIDYTWGAHGWAEVYFPDYGWVPFDVTFAEYGWLDPSHLKLKDDVDSGSPTAKYSWKSNGVELDVGQLDIETNVIAVGEDEPGAVEIEVLPVKSVAKFGSHIPIEVKITNVKNTYLAPKIVITKAPGLSEKNVKTLLLEPKEERSLYWIVELPEADPAYIYTTTIEAESMYGETSSAVIKYGEKFEGYSKDWAEAIVKGHAERENKELLSEVTMKCNANKGIYYAGDIAEVSCDLTSNLEDVESFDICFHDKCGKTTLAPEKKTTQTETFNVSESIRIPIAIENKDKVQYAYVNLEVIPIPEVRINDPEPSKVNYNDAVEISFDVTANTDVTDLHINFDFGELQYDSFGKDEVKTITVNTVGSQLIDDLKFEVRYKDQLGTEYLEQKALVIQVNNIPWYGSFLHWLTHLFN